MSEKVYRSTTTGDRGFLTERGGAKFVRLDRTNQVIEKPYKEDEWTEESPHRPLLPHHLSRIFFEAEKHLLIALGDPQGRDMDWDMMVARQKNIYRNEMDDQDNPLVKKLHKAMHKVLDPLSQ